MNFWQSALQVIANIGRSWRVTFGRGAPPIDSASSASGVIVTQDKALTLSAVWACVRLKSQTTSTLPIGMYERVGTGKRFAPEHPLHELIHDQPNANMTAVEFWEMLVVGVLLWGNGYAAKRMAGDRVIALDPWLPQYVTPYLNDRGLLKYRYSDGKTQEDLPADQVLHIKGLTADGLAGLSPISFAANSLGLALSAESTAASVLKDGLTGRQIYMMERVLTKDQREQFRELMATFQDATKRGQPFLLEGGMKYQGVTLNPNDAELLASRSFSVEDICRWFDVPPQLIGHTDKASSWASSLENTNLGFLTYGLRPLLTRIEQAIRKSLLSPAERQRFYAKFSIEGLMRADSAGRAALMASTTQNGVMTRGEWREIEDLDEKPGDDQLTVQSNLVPLDKLGQMVPSSEAAKNALKAWLMEPETK